MVRWALVAPLLVIVGCKGSKKPACDPATGPSVEWAHAEYVAQGGDKVDPATLKITASPTRSGLFELTRGAGEPRIASVWKCKVHRDPRALAKLVLLEEGWAAANAPMRHTLATKVYGELLEAPLAAPGKDWDTTREFTAPTTATLPDTSVKLVHWYADRHPALAFTQEEVVIAADGTVGASKQLATYTPGRTP